MMWPPSLVTFPSDKIEHDRWNEWKQMRYLKKHNFVAYRARIRLYRNGDYFIKPHEFEEVWFEPDDGGWEIRDSIVFCKCGAHAILIDSDDVESWNSVHSIKPNYYENSSSFRFGKLARGES